MEIRMICNRKRTRNGQDGKRPELFFRLLAAAAALLLLCTLFGCAGKSGTETEKASAAVTAMCDAIRATENGLPRGQLYTSGAGEGEAGYVTNGLLAAFLGDGKTVPWQAEAAVSYAFYLSYTSPVTLAVFRCGTVGGAEDLALLLSERLRLYRVHWAGSDWEEAVAGAAVEVSGSDVLLAVAPDGRALIRRGREGLR